MCASMCVCRRQATHTSFVSTSACVCACVFARVEVEVLAKVEVEANRMADFGCASG